MKPVVIDITNRIYVKKNNKRVGINKYSGKRFVLPSINYVNSLEAIGWQIREQYHGTPIKGKLRVEYIFYIKGEEVVDTDNLMGSVNDMLQDFNVIDNDKNIKKGSFEILNNTGRWGAKIIIEPLDA